MNYSWSRLPPLGLRSAAGGREGGSTTLRHQNAPGGPHEPPKSPSITAEPEQGKQGDEFMKHCREVAFREHLKIHDIILEGIEMALRNRGRRK